MSRTRAARATNSRDSSAGRPNSLTSVAPGAEKRSVIWLPIAALWSAASRSSRASRRPIRRAGSTNTGSSTSASSVTCHESVSITPSASASVTTLPTTPDSVSLNARCAPITSLFSLLTSAPVRVRVKKATGMRWTCENTAARRSRIRPSPIRAENHRVTTPSPASATAMTAISTASPTTTPGGPPVSIASTTRPASTGVATASTAPTTLSTRNTASRRRCGRAKPGDAAQRGRGERPALVARRASPGRASATPAFPCSSESPVPLGRCRGGSVRARHRQFPGDEPRTRSTSGRA